MSKDASASRLFPRLMIASQAIKPKTRPPGTVPNSMSRSNNLRAGPFRKPRMFRSVRRLDAILGEQQFDDALAAFLAALQVARAPWRDARDVG